MTLTETRPSETTDDVVAVPVERGAAAWAVTGDHKRLGLMFAAGGVVSLIAALAAAFLLRVVGESPVSFTLSGDSRLASLATAGAFVIGIPALWIGLATYVMPLQVGAHRLALPRLHNLALWLFFAGGALVVIGHLADRPDLESLASSAPSVAIAGERANDAALLAVAGLAIVALGTLFAAAGLFVTVLTRRGEGFRLVHAPAFTWSVLSTSLVLVLSTPVFVAGLVLLYLDQRYGGTLFASGRGGQRIWQHELWLLGRPESLVFFGACIGIYCDIVATSLRRPLAAYPVARFAAAAAPLFSLLAWIGATSVLRSPFAPFATAAAVLIGVAPVIAVLTWLLSARGGRPRLLAGTVPLLFHFVLDGLFLAIVVAGVLGDVGSAREAEAFRDGNVALFLLGQPLLGFTAGLLYWAPKLRGRVPGLASGAGVGGLVLLGVALLAAPGYLAGLDAGEDMEIVGAIGAAVVVLALLAVLPTIVGPAGDSPGDPYEGHTLEWAAASPPARHNFEEVPDIRSAHPLYDARHAATEAGA
ncbi:MAG TPA: cbb3-type cytochrome c oxidase subunit I [Acidimicrobiales bacterium]